ncbi:MAG: hypothetical protein J5642_03295 [Bacteroidales bacterium]|nr:hypothetical protein [Bacteroidales bacterium]
MLKFRSFLFLLLGILWGMNGLAQVPNVSVSARLDSTHILIGDHLKLHLSATVDLGHKAAFQDFSQWQLLNCEVIEAATPVTTQGKGTTTCTQEITVISFDTGMAVIAPICLVVDDTLADYFTDTLAFHVDSLPVFVDTTKAFCDIKLPMDGKRVAEGGDTSSSKTWSIVLIVLGVLLILGLLAFLFFKYLWPYWKKKRQQVLQIRRKELSGTVALNQIRQLKAKELCQKGMVKEHYSELSMILRTYMDDQWNVNAKEMVTDEIMESIGELGLDEVILEDVRRFLRRSDLVKYARQQPMMEENDDHLKRVTHFVAETDRVEQAKLAELKQKKKHS